MEQNATLPNPAATPQKKAVIVGAGPTGSLMALYLAQMGWPVWVYERRPATSASYGPRRPYNLVLNERGLKAIAQAGVELPPDKRVVLQGNVRHTAKGAALSQGFSNSVSVSIDRSILAQCLVQAGKDRFPSQIQYHFQHTLQTINFQTKTVGFQGPTGEHQQTFDLLIGADGAFSTVRTEMVAQLPGFQVRQNQDEMQFKICQLGLATDLPGATDIWGECFHTWPSAQPASLLAPPSVDGVLRGILILPQKGRFTYETLQTEAAIATLFAEKFPDIFPELSRKGFPPEFVEDLRAQKAAYGGITTICNRFDGDGVVVLGDAAHSVWASLGQGCNVALESCRVLAETLAQNQGDLNQALARYTAIRKPDTDAIAKLSEIGFGGNKRVGNLFFFSKVIVLMFLHKLFPRWFQKFALLQIGNAEVPYRQIWQQSQTQNRQFFILLTAVIGLLLPMVGLIVRLGWD